MQPVVQVLQGYGRRARGGPGTRGVPRHRGVRRFGRQGGRGVQGPLRVAATATITVTVTGVGGRGAVARVRLGAGGESQRAAAVGGRRAHAHLDLQGAAVRYHHRGAQGQFLDLGTARVPCGAQGDLRRARTGQHHRLAEDVVGQPARRAGADPAREERARPLGIRDLEHRAQQGVTGGPHPGLCGGRRGR